jgi:hypothetical protein
MRQLIIMTCILLMSLARDLLILLIGHVKDQAMPQFKNDGLRAGESFASTDTDPFDREFHCSSVQRSALNHVERSQQRCGM